MKTTLELPDALLIEAKAAAVHRRTTLRAIMEHALRRELGEFVPQKGSKESATELNAYGFPVLKRKKGQEWLTSKMVYALQDQEDHE
jgi:hypothetical protein